MPIPTIGASIPTNAGLIPAMIPKKPIIPPTITTINNVSVSFTCTLYLTIYYSSLLY
ncbi:MAG: hypothetical protein HOC40_02145 [Candidatus Thioglobus sp.]|nr:hypothetical protein [Candidatus Thioglobus sp.]